MGYIQTVGWKNKFLKYWGTEVIDDGIEVLKEKTYTYPKSLVDEDLLRHLKVYEDVMASNPEGIVLAWLYINPDKFNKDAVVYKQDEAPMYTYVKSGDIWLDTNNEDTQYKYNGSTWVPDSSSIVGLANGNIEGDVLANKINRELDEDKQYTIYIVSLYGSNTLYEAVDKIADVEITGDYTEYMANLKEYILDNYVDILANYTVEGDNDNSIAYLISKYAMMPDVEKLDVDIVDLAITTLDKPITYDDADGNVRKPIWYRPQTYKDVTITITLNVHRNSSINDTDPVFIHIAEGDRIRALEAQQLLEDENAESDGIFSTLSWVKPEVTNDYFYKNRLRASVLSHKESGIKVKDAVNLVTASFDSGYQQKKTKWYKKFIGIIVFIIAVILAIPSGGASLSAAAAAMTLGEVAFALAIGALAVNLTVAAMSMWGDTTGAQANQPFAKAAGILSTFVGIANIINNIVNKIVLASATEAVKQEAMKQAAMELGTEASKEAVTELAKEYAIEATRSITIDGVKEYVSDMVTGVVNSITKVSLEQAIRTVNFVAKFVMANETVSLQKELEAKKNALAKQEEELATQTALQRDLSMAFMNSYTKPLEGMKEPFEVDWQYEGTSGPLHSGNIQIRYHA